MHKKFIFLLLFFIPSLVFSQSDEINNRARKMSKTGFDIQRHQSVNNLKSSQWNNSMRIHATEIWEYSLLSNGCFTLGTQNGISSGILDDKSTISFGHPYAMSSFLYPVIDGYAYKPYGFSENSTNEVLLSGDTLISINGFKPGINTEVRIYPDENEIYISYRLINVDSISHQTSVGFFFDPAIGQWGDGYMLHNENMIREHVSFLPADGEVIQLWERKTTPNGMGVQVMFPETKPAQITVGNWSDLYYNVQPQFDIFDIALQSEWNETNLNPGDTAVFKVKFALSIPEYNQEPFLRWDLPTALSIENNFLFPMDFLSNVQILNEGGSYNNLSLKIKETDYTYGWESPDTIAISGDVEIYYTQTPVEIPEVYDSLVIPVTMQLMQSEVIIDELTRYLFIPETPYSDTGLMVHIDTAFLDGNKVSISFRSEIEATDQIVYELRKPNVLLYDNGAEVADFILGKDTSGGVINLDIIFVLDVTGSMSNEIQAVQSNIIEFADSLSAQGVNYRLGMVTFLDVIENIYPFTNDVQAFQLSVSQQFAHGGGDTPENSLDALAAAATEFEFREDANRMVIWITDADFHINNANTQQTKSSVINLLLSRGIQVHCIGSEQYQTDYYDQIVQNTGGKYFNINGNFRDILLETTRLGQSLKHLLTFYRDNSPQPGDIFKIEIHHAGLGGWDTLSYESIQKPIKRNGTTDISLYPNPFISNASLYLNNPHAHKYQIKIFSVTGKLMQEIHLENENGQLNLPLSEMINLHTLSQNQVYLMQVTVLDENAKPTENITIKIKRE